MVLVGCSQSKPLQTCAPDTLARLSNMYPITNATSSDSFAKLMGTDSEGTPVESMVKVWNRLYPDHPLVKALDLTSVPPTMNPELKINFETPNVWVGKYVCGKQTNDHCTLMYWLDENRICLSHSQYYPGTTNFYRETNSVSWMMHNTYVVYVVK